MSPITVGTAIGAAALTVGTGALTAVGNGLSFAAELARGAGGSTSAAEGSGPNHKHDHALQPQIKELRQRALQCLAEAGVELSEPVDLISNGQGGIAVVGPHPQQAAIEAALSADVLLEHDFQRLAADCAEPPDDAAATDRPAAFTITVPADDKSP